jgi:hypothetical protein
MSIFKIQKSDSISSENLNISKSGDDNGILLSISAILQGYRSESELTELLSNISNDISSDGILNSDSLGSILINQAVMLDTILIRNNLVQRYKDIGTIAIIPNFEKYVKLFIDSSKYKFTSSINYPKNGKYGLNVLSDSNKVFHAGFYSLSASLPKGMSLKIKYISTGYKAIYQSSIIGWTLDSEMDMTTRTSYLILNADGNTQIVDAKMELTSTDSFVINFYENNSLNPTKTKTISW